MPSYTWVKKWSSESCGAPGERYTVSISTDGTWGCSCPKWKFRRMICKHIREIQAIENWNNGSDPKWIMELTALRAERLKARGKSDDQITDDISKIINGKEIS